MQRSIKFRAWWRGEMYDAVLFDFRKGSKGLGIGYIDNPSWGVRWPDSEELILMQFIGLKDKDGEEIYEGDIVRHPLCVAEPHDENEPCETFMGRIQFEVDRGQYFAVNLKRNGYVIEMSEAYKFEVIGNINENPELIKEE